MSNFDWLERVNVRDVCWLAGFLDADGNISIVKRKTYLCPVVGFTNTNKKIIDNVTRILDALDVGYCLSFQDRGERVNAKPAWNIRCDGKPRVAKILGILRDDLVGKQEQADLLLQWCELPSATTHRQKGGKHKTQHPDGYWSIREKVQVLNHRGRKPRTARVRD